MLVCFYFMSEQIFHKHQGLLDQALPSALEMEYLCKFSGDGNECVWDKPEVGKDALFISTLPWVLQQSLVCDGLFKDSLITQTLFRGWLFHKMN